ncbi:hypothetical protein DRW03_14115 [Corallococcus sp. H22C18031201]|nr:hypothetical protein DRW03_14115 [Corallococcus sp. H22C18031201]
MVRARSWWLLLVALVLVGGCHCGDGGVSGSRGGFRVRDEGEVDFGRVLEGTQARRAVTLVATGRASASVTASVEGAPFSVVTASVTVPGAGETAVDVVFTAGGSAEAGTLVLTSGSSSVAVPLKGTGVHPLTCLPSAECRESRFDLATGTCIETPQDDGASCNPSSRCQEHGRCQAGVCAGTPRSCDDDNPCTVDSCSPTRGCVNTDVVCPASSNPCKVGVCNRNRGCVEADAEDFQPCGSVDCKHANVCFSGTCKSVPTPEGFLCAPATACQGEGHCASGECARPDAGDLTPTFSQVLGGVPVAEDGGPVLLSQGTALLASLCDADAGCRLVSYTSQGLLRFEAPYPDGGPRTLVASSDGGVLVRAPEALESYALSAGGVRQWAAALSALSPEDAGLEGWRAETGAGQVALTPEGNILAYVTWTAPEEDGGLPTASRVARLVWLNADGGTVLRAGPMEPGLGSGRLAVDATGRAYLFTPDGRLVLAESEDSDAGVAALRLVTLGDGVPDAGLSLSVVAGRLWLGASAFTDTDGGVRGRADWTEPSQQLSPWSEPALMSPAATGYAFALACGRPPGVACPPEEVRVVLRAFGSDDGRRLWDVDVRPFDTEPGSLLEAALLEGGGVGVLADSEERGGRRTWLEMFTAGKRVSMCPLPGLPHVAGAVFAGGALSVVLERDGVWRLESYALDRGAVAETRGWPQRHGGAAGARRAGP